MEQRKRMAEKMRDERKGVKRNKRNDGKEK